MALRVGLGPSGSAVLHTDEGQNTTSYMRGKGPGGRSSTWHKFEGMRRAGVADAQTAQSLDSQFRQARQNKAVAIKEARDKARKLSALGIKPTTGPEGRRYGRAGMGPRRHPAGSPIGGQFKAK